MRRISLSFVVLLSLFNYVPAAENVKKLTILIQPFTGSGEKSASWIAKGITDTVVSDMSRISSINVVTEEDRRRALREIELAIAGHTDEEVLRNAGVITGANIIVTGNLTVAKSSIRITARIINAVTGKITSSVKLDGLVEDIFALQDNIILSLIEEIKKSGIEGFIPSAISSEDKTRIASKSIPPVTSYELYARALVVSESNTSEALLLCDKAIAVQPDYYEAIILGAFLENSSGHPSIALARIQRAKAVLKRRGTAGDLTMAFIEMNRAPILFALKRYKESLDSYESAKAIFEKASMSESSNYASILFGMAESKRGLGDNRAALKLSNQALATIEKLGMTKSGTYGWALLNKGNYSAIQL